MDGAGPMGRRCRALAGAGEAEAAGHPAGGLGCAEGSRAQAGGLLIQPNNDETAPLSQRQSCCDWRRRDVKGSLFPLGQPLRELEDRPQQARCQGCSPACCQWCAQGPCSPPVQVPACTQRLCTWAPVWVKSQATHRLGSAPHSQADGPHSAGATGSLPPEAVASGNPHPTVWMRGERPREGSRWPWAPRRELAC